MEFSDLNDEIGADDWLIPSEEISRRRLIKQTPRYNIYKADWFGDVLVYEPAGSIEQIKEKKQQLASRRQKHNEYSRFDHEELSSRLSSLNLNLNKWSEMARSQLSLGSDSEQTDSAYSSISSTPQYHTKNIESEFEFPSKLSPASLNSISSLTDINNNISIEDLRLKDKIQYSSEKQVKQHPKNKSPMIVNKDSYTFGCQFRQSNLEEQSETSETKQSSWFEINELRLVAHESFMLFMGASMNQTKTIAPSTSLVMQMNHPKAISLYNLLHTTKLSNSPIDRFFAFKHQRQQLSIETKLNICQQVTNAMTYLHDKNIVHGRLTSVNIYIELNQRVKISLIDNNERTFATPIRGQNSQKSVQFNLPSLTYLSPELIKTINVSGEESECDNEPWVQIDLNQLTKQSDIFSFGTLLFELFEEKFPFGEAQENSLATTFISNLPIGLSTIESPFDSMLSNWNGNIKVSAAELIFQIGSGQIESKNLNRQIKNNNRCPALVECIISACWSKDLIMRPQFKQLWFA